MGYLGVVVGIWDFFVGYSSVVVGIWDFYMDYCGVVVGVWDLHGLLVEWLVSETSMCVTVV